MFYYAIITLLTNMQDKSSELSCLQFFCIIYKAQEFATELRYNTSGLILVQLSYQIRFSCRKIIVNRNTYQN
jgi:uncharacterized protein YihD (DUF1040 family)